MKEMSDSGLFSIQSHTYDLHHKVDIDSFEKSAMIAEDSNEYHKKVIDALVQ